MFENILLSAGSHHESSLYDNSYLDDIYTRNVPQVVHPVNDVVHPVTTLEKDNQPLKHSVSQALPGTDISTHNITCLPADDSSSSVQVETDCEQLGTSASDVTNTSITSQNSTSPQSTSDDSSISDSMSTASCSDRAISPENTNDKPKKKARTNYTHEQLQSLLKIFHETPYPDSEMIENIGKDLGIPQNKIKIWFQNKRARWRRQGNDNMKNYPQSLLPVSPMLSPVTPYGFMPTGHMMTSSSPQYLPGYVNYPWMQGSTFSNINQQLPFQVSTNQMHSRLQATNQNANFQNQHYPINSTTHAMAMSSAMYDPRTSAQQVTSHYNRHPFQCAPFTYQSPYNSIPL